MSTRILTTHSSTPFSLTRLATSFRHPSPSTAHSHLTPQTLLKSTYINSLLSEYYIGLNAFESLTPYSYLRDRAAESEARWKNGQELSAVDGLGFTVKCNIAIDGRYGTNPNHIPSTSPSPTNGDFKGHSTTAGSLILSSYKSPYSADVLQRLIGRYDEDEHDFVNGGGALCIGITRMDEFGMGSYGINIPKKHLSNYNDNREDVRCSPRNSRPFYPLDGHASVFLPTGLILPPEFTTSITNPSLLQDDKDEYMHTMDNLLDELLGTQSDSNNNFPSYPLQPPLTVKSLIETLHKISSQKPPQTTPSLFPSSQLSTAGSSSGSVSSLASRSCQFTLGTDTGGSIRLPSAWSSLYGFKPTYGRISRLGVVAYGSSLDCVGFCGKFGSDSRVVWDVVRGGGRGDMSSISRDSEFGILTKTNDVFKNATNELPLNGVKVGIPQAYIPSDLPPLIKTHYENTANHLRTLGATVVTLPDSKNALKTRFLSSDTIKLSLSAYYIIACAEASSNLSRYTGLLYGSDQTQSQSQSQSQQEDDGEQQQFLDQDYTQSFSSVRSNLFGDEVKSRIICGVGVLSNDTTKLGLKKSDNDSGGVYQMAQVLRFKIRDEFDSCFRRDEVEAEADADGVDFLLLPTQVSEPMVLDDVQSKKWLLLNPSQQPPSSSSSSSSSSIEKETDTRLVELMGLADDLLTVGVSLAGLPCLSIPVAEGVGMQIVGRRGGDEDVLMFGERFL